MGNQLITTTPEGIAIKIAGQPKLMITSQGLRFESGFALQDTPSVIVTNISDDPTFASASHSQLATSIATRAYIDNKILSASFDTLHLRSLCGRDGGAITITGPAITARNVTIACPISLSTAHVIASAGGTTHEVASAIVFVTANSPRNAVDVVSLPEYAVNFINESASATPALLRFDCGCALLNGALKFMHTSDEQLHVERWLCFGSQDEFFPTRVIPMEPIEPSALSIAMNAAGSLLVIGSSMDGGERGCVRVVYRSHATWLRACQKIVGSCTIETRHQGLICAINAQSTVFAFANEHEIWCFAIEPTAGQYHSIAIREFAHLAAPFSANISALRFSAVGDVLVVASTSKEGENGAAIYDLQQGGCVLRVMTPLFCAPLALNGAGTVCFASSLDGNSVIRAEITGSEQPRASIVGALAQGEGIVCDVRGLRYAVGCSASAHLRTKLVSTVDESGASFAVVTHDDEECARIEMPCEIRAHCVSADGSFAVVCLADGTMKMIY